MGRRRFHILFLIVVEANCLLQVNSRDCPLRYIIKGHHIRSNNSEVAAFPSLRKTLC